MVMSTRPGTAAELRAAVFLEQLAAAPNPASRKVAARLARVYAASRELVACYRSIIELNQQAREAAYRYARLLHAFDGEVEPEIAALRRGGCPVYRAPDDTADPERLGLELEVLAQLEADARRASCATRAGRPPAQAAGNGPPGAFKVPTPRSARKGARIAATRA